MSIIPVARVNNQSFRRQRGSSLLSGAILGPLRAVPFAQGYKANTISGGRGSSDIRVVDNLNASGSGSLSDAMSATPLSNYIVLFSVAGVIPLTDNVFQHSDTTIDFASAPSPGITLRRALGTTDTNRGCLYNINGTQSNMIVSHLRLRDRNDLTAPTNQSLLFVGYQDPDHGYASAGGSQIFIDHLSTAWAGDEHAFVASPSVDVTFWRCFMGPSAYAGHTSLVCDSDTAASDVARLLYQQCYWPLNFDRCPQAKIGSKYAMYNNYLYACGHNVGVDPACFTGFFALNNTATGIGTTEVSARGNVYEANSVNGRPQFEFDQTLGDHSHKSYFNDNPTWVRCVESPAVVTAVANETDLTMGLPEVATVLSSSAVKALVLANAGARIHDRDFVDQGAIDAVTDPNATPLTGAPPSLYTLGTASLACNYPGDHTVQAPGEAAGWTKMDLWRYQRALLVGAL